MKKILLFLLLIVIVLLAVVRLRYGGGDPYADLTTTPRLDAGELETVLTYPEPIGNVAVNADGRVFFTVHPESRPTGNRLLEFVDGASVPYPDVSSQLDLFDTVLGLVIDRQNRLWAIDHGFHGLRSARLLAFDLDNGEILVDYRFTKDIAPAGSFLQDVQVSADGSTVVIADASFFRKKPALVIVDVSTGDVRRVLEGDTSVAAENTLIRAGGVDMSFFGGTYSLRGGVDGIALGPEWLYFAALSGTGLYRVRLTDLKKNDLSATELANRVERIADKPLSDGLSVDADGTVYITDVEHNAISIIGSDGKLQTLVRSPDIRWPDALSFGPDGWLYIADSALQDVILKSRRHIDAQGPYKVFRINTGSEGYPGR